MENRNYTALDRLLVNADQALRTIMGAPLVTERPDPADAYAEAELSAKERAKAAGLMRINHTGEVCAQALYQGQALTAKLPQVREKMERAAQEENDHLAWCDARLRALDSHKSLFNPLWYAGSFIIGATAGVAGDKWSLGFVAETEHQVEAHLKDHLGRWPSQDQKSRAVLEQMKLDELQHAKMALAAGGEKLPAPIKLAMKISAKVMTSTVRWL
ncbi:MAG: 2-polyprenyl-3-methyl-6-methoxy-1,4-benzoquinone monooxygenase [Candidatus Polarisedimenticolaceae bacterium]|nr:2-polyprenyl-3-methyl-6-methoxy-1,4-benzoquinone monooxygenase [Candidatus Polarisedimenticolaceae bacterium]